MSISTFVYAVAAALFVTFLGWLGNHVVRRKGMFAGTWTAKYVAANGIEIKEVLNLKSLFPIVWGKSTCTWEENGQKKTGRYKVRGLFQTICLMGVYIPAKSDEHDMGVFIILLHIGSNPTTAAGLITNFESDPENPDKQGQQPLVGRTYLWTREVEG